MWFQADFPVPITIDECCGDWASFADEKLSGPNSQAEFTGD